MIHRLLLLDTPSYSFTSGGWVGESVSWGATPDGDAAFRRLVDGLEKTDRLTVAVLVQHGWRVIGPPTEGAGGGGRWRWLLEREVPP